jgi:hypothetical protein
MTTEELFALWKREAQGDKLTQEEDKALVDGLVESPELRKLIKEREGTS